MQKNKYLQEILLLAKPPKPEKSMFSQVEIEWHLHHLLKSPPKRLVKCIIIWQSCFPPIICNLLMGCNYQVSAWFRSKIANNAGLYINGRFHCNSIAQPSNFMKSNKFVIQTCISWENKIYDISHVVCRDLIYSYAFSKLLTERHHPRFVIAGFYTM